MFQTYKSYIFAIFIMAAMLFCGKTPLFGENIIKISDNGTLTIDITKDVDKNLKNYIKSSIPFKCEILIELKKYSGMFFIKDKILKKYHDTFKFNYDILKKQFSIIKGSEYFSTKTYKEFLKMVGIIKIENFLNIGKEKSCYIEADINFTPVKGSFKLSDIYILNNIKNFRIYKKLNLEGLFGH